MPAHTVNAFFQDKTGFLWMATNNGFSRFDGQEYLPFAHENKELSIETDQLTPCAKELLLVHYKNNSCHLFNCQSEHFQSLNSLHPALSAQKTSGYILSSNRLFCIRQSPKVEIIEKEIPKSFSNTIININGAGWSLSEGNLYSLSVLNDSVFFKKELNGDFYAIHLDSQQKLWLSSSSKGLLVLDTKTGSIEQIAEATAFPGGHIISFSEGPGDQLWFVLPLNGIGFYDKKNKQIWTVKNIEQHPQWNNGYQVFSDLVDHKITNLFFDRRGMLWIGTQQNGMFSLRFEQQRFQYYKFDYRKEDGLAHQDISFPLAVKNGDVWIGTWGGGINVWKKEELKTKAPHFRSIRPQKGKAGALQQGRVFPIMEDSRGNLWCGTNGEGLHILEKSNREKSIDNFRHISYSPYKPFELPSDSILSLVETGNSEIWIGTNRGLACWDANSKQITSRFTDLENPEIFYGHPVWMVAKDSSEALWLSIQDIGLFYWDRKNNVIKHFLTGEDGLDRIYALSDGPGDFIWLAGRSGLLRINKRTEEIRRYGSKDGLPTDLIESMLRDQHGRLWLGCNNGLACFNTADETVTIHCLQDGVMCNSFTQGASVDTNGYFYMGSRNGFYRFHPDSVSLQHTAPSICLTGLDISGKNIRQSPNHSKQLTGNKPLHSVDNIELAHHQNAITIRYSSLNFNTEAPTLYEVMLEGLSDHWEQTVEESRTWSGLAPGKYRFRVKNSNQQNETNLTILIVPPWWNHWWSWIAYLLLLLGVTLGTIRYLLLRSKNKEQARQKEYYDRMRFRFFLNVSHEIRTPLTLILGGIERLATKYESGSENKEIQRISKNAVRLQHMINEVLNLNKLDRFVFSPSPECMNINSFIESVVDAFQIAQACHSIQLKLPSEALWATADRQLLETVLYNLLSNAMKFSESEEKITVNIRIKNDETISITVQDSGIGIPTEEQALIFDRFYQGGNHQRAGTGIGLSLVKEMLETVNGSISVTSETGEGSTFTVEIPYLPCLPVTFSEEIEQAPEIVTTTNEKKSDQEKLTLLIVDDQIDIRNFVAEIFSEKYRIIQANNGKEALDLIDTQLPDLIISDVMMPMLDGYTLCNRIRENKETSHLPIILLTAKTGTEAEQEAFACKADAFVNKPFNQRILKQRVDNLLEQRRTLREKYSKSPDAEITSLAVRPIDEEFLKKVEFAILSNLTTPNFGVEKLAFEMAMSASGLFRKFKALTGMAPVEFIQLSKLRNAAHLLKTSTMQIIEIAETSGFGDAKYFSKCFKLQFGVSPSEYRKKNQLK